MNDSIRYLIVFVLLTSGAAWAGGPVVYQEDGIEARYADANHCRGNPVVVIEATDAPTLFDADLRQTIVDSVIEDLSTTCPTAVGLSVRLSTNGHFVDSGMAYAPDWRLRFAVGAHMLLPFAIEEHNARMERLYGDRVEPYTSDRVAGVIEGLGDIYEGSNSVFFARAPSSIQHGNLQESRQNLGIQARYTEMPRYLSGDVFLVYPYLDEEEQRGPTEPLTADRSPSHALVFESDGVRIFPREGPVNAGIIRRESAGEHFQRNPAYTCFASDFLGEDGCFLPIVLAMSSRDSRSREIVREQHLLLGFIVPERVVIGQKTQPPWQVRAIARLAKVDAEEARLSFPQIVTDDGDAGATTPVFADMGDWPDVSGIPDLTPDFDYRPSQSAEFIGLEGVRSDDMLGDATNAALQLTSIAQSVGLWRTNFESARQAFWDDYATTGEVDRDLRNEYAYWLHVREEWSTIWQSVKARQLGIFGALFERGGPNDFLPEGAFVWKVDGPSIVGEPDRYRGSERYAEYFRELSFYQWLQYCDCSPMNSSTTMRARIFALLQHDTFERMERLRPVLTMIDEWANDDPQKLQSLIDRLLEGQTIQGGHHSPISFAMRFMQSEDESILDQAFVDFQNRTRLNWAYFAGTGGRVKRKLESRGVLTHTVEFNPYGHDRTVDIPLEGVSWEQLGACVAELWPALQSEIYSKNPTLIARESNNASTRNHTLRNDMYYVAASRCSESDPVAAYLPFLLERAGLSTD